MMSGENFLNLLIITSEDEYKEFFLNLLNSTDLKWSTSIFCKTQHEAEVEFLKTEPNFIVIFLNKSSSNLLEIESWLNNLNIEIPSLILYVNNLSIDKKQNIDYYELSKITPELLSKTITSALEKQRLLLQLESSEEKWLYFNSLSHDIVWEWNIGNNIIQYNSIAFAKFFGKDINKGIMLFDNWIDLVDPVDREKVKELFATIIPDPNQITFELDYRMNVNGILVFVNEKGYIKRSKRGVAISAIGILQNLTQKVKGEKEIKRLSHIAEETLNGVLITNADGLITWCNKSFTELSGYNLEEVYGKKPGDVLQGDETSKIAIRFMSGKLKRQKSFKCDLLNYKKSGEKYWVRIFCQPQFDDNGNIDSYFSIIADISLERDSHQKLLDNEKKYRSLIEHSKDGLSIISNNPTRVDILAGRNILGYSNDDYNNSLPESYIHPDDVELVNSAFMDIISDPSKSESREYRAYKKEVGYIWIESTFHNMLNVP
ncbi:MAG: PAS domain-containing protein, partial [Ferruginibacter sp.]